MAIWVLDLVKYTAHILLYMYMRVVLDVVILVTTHFRLPCGVVNVALKGSEYFVPRKKAWATCKGDN